MAGSLCFDSPMLTGNTRSQDQVNYFHPTGTISTIQFGGSASLPNTLYTGAKFLPISRFENLDIDTSEDLLLTRLVASSYIHADSWPFLPEDMDH